MAELPSGFIVHHTALAVRDMDASTRALSRLDYVSAPDYPDIVVDEQLGVRLRFLIPRAGGILLELVEDIGERGPVAKILQRNGVTLYHLCFEVPDLAASAELLQRDGYLAVSKKMPAAAFGGRLIQFLYHKDSGLVELLSAS